MVPRLNAHGRNRPPVIVIMIMPEIDMYLQMMGNSTSGKIVYNRVKGRPYLSLFTEVSSPQNKRADLINS